MILTNEFHLLIDEISFLVYCFLLLMMYHLNNDYCVCVNLNPHEIKDAISYAQILLYFHPHKLNALVINKHFNYDLND
jgi:hypothetical protein